MHLIGLNRGILMTPFHNMARLACDITEAEVKTHTRVFHAAAAALFDDKREPQPHAKP
jgi:glutamate-1-semialdehyde 2,1-aminomutase